jgi:small conductance mechanosensitive channel
MRMANSGIKIFLMCDAHLLSLISPKIDSGMIELPTEFFDELKIMVIGYGGKFLMAIVVLVVGFWVGNRMVGVLRKTMERRDVDPSLRPFLLSILSVVFKVVVIFTVLGMVGVQMTSFIAILGSAGLAVGLALQGSLANFAGGVLILLLKPFKVGDFIDTGNHQGSVREIRIFYTYLTTFQNQEIIIPNGQLSNNSVTNYNFHSTRRFDMEISFSYSDDMAKAKKLIEDLVESEPRFLNDEQKVVFVKRLGDSAVILHVRAWLNLDDYWDVTNNFNEHVKNTFDQNGITIPFPQRQIHMTKG